MQNLAQQLINYLLHLADTTLILSQRNSEWCGHGPVLEQALVTTERTIKFGELETPSRVTPISGIHHLSHTIPEAITFLVRRAVVLET